MYKVITRFKPGRFFDTQIIDTVYEVKNELLPYASSTTLCFNKDFNKKNFIFSSAAGEYAWIYSDFMDGLDNFYNNRPLGVKVITSKNY